VIIPILVTPQPMPPRRPRWPSASVQASGAQRGSRAGIDKGAPAIAAPRRYRDREHMRYVMKQLCLICGQAAGLSG